MNRENNFEFELKKEFNKQSPTFPDKLQKENVIAMLNEKKIKPSKKKGFTWKKAVALAASLVIIFSAVLMLPDFSYELKTFETYQNKIGSTYSSGEPSYKPQTDYLPIKNDLPVKKLKTVISNDDLIEYFTNKYKENKLDDFVDGVFSFSYMKTEDVNMVANGAAPEDGAPMATAPTISGATGNQGALAQTVPAYNGPQEQMTTAPAVNTTPLNGNEDMQTSAAVTAPESAPEEEKSEPHGETNAQVENVDEADIIKNDGRYLYILKNNGNVVIFDTKTMSVTSEIEREENRDIIEMYVGNGRLVLLGIEFESLEEDEEVSHYTAYINNSGKATSYVYDISDKGAPELIRSVNQDGDNIVSSRMIDSVLYTVSNYRVYADSLKEVEEKAIPDVNGEQIKCDCIYIYDEDSQQYLVVTAYNTAEKDSEVSSLSVLGGGSDVYCSENSLYVYHHNLIRDTGENITDIYSFSIDGENIEYTATSSAKGYPNNQYSFDEYNGILRVATTYYSYQKDVDVSSIYAYDKDLQLIGKLEDIAFDEQIKSVRFIGDVGYIVTFKNTDPLFTLDLADPTNMAVIGEVKLPGFSSYLHPVGEDLVIGVGYDGTEENATWNSVKVSLFDVSDLKNPKEVNNFILKDAYTSVNDDPKAFLYYPEHNYIGIPVEHYNTQRAEVLSYKLLKIENGEISSHLGYTHGVRQTYGFFRGTYIGNMLYTIDSYKVIEHNIESGEKLRECIIGEKEEAVYYGDTAETVPAYNSADSEVLTTEGYNPGVVMTAPAYNPEDGDLTEVVGTSALKTTATVSDEDSDATTQYSTIPATMTEPYMITDVIG